MPWHRLVVEWTYSTSTSAATALTNVNNTLAAQGRAERATRTSNSITVEIEPLTETTAITLRNALTPSWATGTRTAGKASVVMRDEGSA